MADNIEDKLKITPFPGDNDLLQFVDSHRVALKVGEYTIKVTQTVTGKEELGSKEVTFFVRGERFSLPPSAVRSVFPPAGSQGNHWHTIPHIVLERSTLPWERSALKSAKDPQINPPWLALLVLHASDTPPPVTQKKIGDLIPNEENREGADANDIVSVITVDVSLLPKDSKELDLLTHVSRRLAEIGTFDNLADAEKEIDTFAPHAIKKALSEKEKNDISTDLISASIHQDPISGETFEVLQMKGEEHKLYHVAHEAVGLLANRLPQPGERNIVHLVSLEGKYPLETGDIELVSLFQWEFFCQNEPNTLKGQFDNLDRNPWGLPEPLPKDEKGPGKYFAAGFVPLRHRFRDGRRSISWYHGPLIPFTSASAAEKILPQGKDLDVSKADDLLYFYKTHNMFDTSYAAAWELGRMLTLQNTPIALRLYNQKRQEAQNINALRHLVDYNYHLPGAAVAQTAVALAPETDNWLAELNLLEHIPFAYLIPDERLLPPESIRFFKVDPQWMKCLRDGAFSIGNVSTQKAPVQSGSNETFPVFTGFLLRSEIVSGRPAMQMVAYKTLPAETTGKKTLSQTDVLLPARKVKLSPQVLLVLFEGEVKAVDFFMPPEALHFGFDEPDSSSDLPEKLVKELRDPVTGEIITENNVEITFPIQLRDTPGNDKSKRILNIAEMFTSDGVHSGTVALKLIAGNEIIRVNPPSPVLPTPRS